MTTQADKKAQGTRVLDANLPSAGPYEQILDLSAAIGMQAIPDGTELAIIQAEGQDIRWTDDGVTTPTATEGMILKKDASIIYNGDFINFQAIEIVAGAKLNISYYG